MRRAHHTAAWQKINKEEWTSRATARRWATAESPATRIKNPRRENWRVLVHATSSSAAPARKRKGYATRREPTSRRTSKPRDLQRNVRAVSPDFCGEWGSRRRERGIAGGRAAVAIAARPAESREAQRTSATDAAACEP